MNHRDYQFQDNDLLILDHEKAYYGCSCDIIYTVELLPTWLASLVSIIFRSTVLGVMNSLNNMKEFIKFLNIKTITFAIKIIPLNSILYLINLNINFMKKIRLEKPSTNTSVLSHKRASLNQDSLALSSKPEWRGASPGNTQNNHSSKVFFQNMKAELSNIKNDFQKLIRKQITLKPAHDPLKIVNSNRQKPYSSAKKDQRSVSEYEKFEFSNFNRDSEEPYSKIFNLEKNLPCSSDQKQFISKTFQLREEKPTPAVFDCVESKPSKVNENEIKSETKALKEKVQYFEAQLSKKGSIVEKLTEEMKNISTEKLSLIVHVSDLNKELSTKNEIVLETEKDNQELRKALKGLEQERSQVSQSENQWAEERHYLNQQLGELVFHHDELRNVHHQVLAENDHLREQLDGVQGFCQDLQRRSASIEDDWRRKLEYLQKDMQSYQKREDMFSAEIQKLNQQLSSQTTISSEREVRIESQPDLNFQLFRLKDQVVHLGRQLQIQKQLHQTLAKKYENQVFDTNNSSELLKTFQQKNSQLVDENARLKTQVNYLESSLESLNEQNRSFIHQIELYEERDKKLTQRKQLSPTQWEEMTEQIQKLKEENSRLNEELENKSFEKEHIKYQSPISEQLLKVTHDQLSEISLLKETVKVLNCQLSSSAKNLEQARLVNMRQKMDPGTRVESLQLELERKSRQEKALKQIIFSVIVKKTSKREDQLDVQYIMREVQLLRNNWK